MVCVGEPFQLNPPVLIVHFLNVFTPNIHFEKLTLLFITLRLGGGNALYFWGFQRGHYFALLASTSHQFRENIVCFPHFHPPTRIRTSQCDKAQKHYTKKKKKQTLTLTQSLLERLTFVHRYRKWKVDLKKLDNLNELYEQHLKHHVLKENAIILSVGRLYHSQCFMGVGGAKKQFCGMLLFLTLIGGIYCHIVFQQEFHC